MRVILLNIFDIERGQKVQSMVPIPALGAALPVTVVRGVQDGPKVLITAGIHNQEYVGIETANRLSLMLQPEDVRGCVAVVHVCNPTGFAAISPDIVPEDGLNLNRVFPGGKDGSAAQRLADLLVEEFLSRASCFIDLHCGGYREQLEPHVYFQGMSDRYLENASRRLAGLVDVNYMVRATSYTGSLFSAAAKLSIPGILVERGGMALWSEEEVSACLFDVQRILHRLNVLARSEHQNTRPRQIGHVDYFSADAEGCWYPAAAAGSIVEKDKPLGCVRDFFGRELMRPTAAADCVILYQTGSLSVRRGDLLAACGELAV